MDPETLRLVSFIWMKTSTVLAVTVGIWALWRGQWPERYGALLIWFTWILSPIVQTPRPGFDPGIATVDTLTLIGFFILSLWSRRFWTAFITAFMLLAVLGHFASLLSQDLSLFVYITANSFWGGYALVFALMAGMISLERQRRFARPDRAASPGPPH